MKKLFNIALVLTATLAILSLDAVAQATPTPTPTPLVYTTGTVKLADGRALAGVNIISSLHPNERTATKSDGSFSIKETEAGVEVVKLTQSCSKSFQGLYRLEPPYDSHAF